MPSQVRLIIDGYGFVFRAYHAQPKFVNKDGTEVGALHGFTAMLMKVLSDFKPDSIVVVFDSGGKNFRHDIYDLYKSHRLPIDESLRLQLPLVRNAVNALGIAALEMKGVEADDVIATIATKYSNNNQEAIIISSDKDLMQLIDQHISMYDPMKGKYIKELEVIEKFGVPPSRVRDVLALIGDKSDYIPGVPSIGPKTAAELILEFGSFENLLNNIQNIHQNKRRLALEEHKEKAILSWKLIGLKTDLDIVLNENFEWHGIDQGIFDSFVMKYDFYKLKWRAEKLPKINTTAENQVDDGNIVVLATDTLIVNQVEILKKLDDISIAKVTPDLKSLIHFAETQKIDHLKWQSIDDISLMHYAFSAGMTQPDKSYFEENIAHKFSTLQSKLHSEGAFEIYSTIDLPLCHVLAKMETNGILLNKKILQDMSHDFALEISDLEKNIYDIAGEEFNIGSTKQLSDILFVKMNLPTGKLLNKTQHYSTNVEVLEHLSAFGYKIADYLLSWRELTKLKNTYIDRLPEQVNSNTGRVHTTFSQISTSTARLSSNNPNLQNIPIRSKYGQKIRSAFVARDDHILISADYSQIELRILGHIADISTMKDAFANNIDIHAVTASKVFNLSMEDVTTEYRRKAKAINFGIIYGISSFGLAKQLGMDKNIASEYISSYFNQYPGIVDYMNKTKAFAHKNGYVANIFGRKLYIPAINSTNTMMRNFAERAAINAPIQSTAADIAKIAMIKIDSAISANNLSSKLLLQIHDELVIESPIEEKEIILSIIKDSMENAIEMSIPLAVDINCGKNLGEL